jgi:cell division protein FtsL
LRAELFMAAMLLACAITIVVWLWPERALLQREPQTVSETGD